MKKISALILILSVSFCMRTVCFGATDSLSKGIHFEKGLSWKQIVEKARLEKKYIFVDCYATWCVPCKKMDKEVYSTKEVGDYFNSKFISVKVQVDTTTNDNVDTRAFYADARNITTLYKVKLYPTLLFFNQDGNLLNQFSGGTDATTFAKFAEDVTSPQKDYYNLLKEYKDGRRNPDEMAFLARTAEGLLNDTIQAKLIADQYMLLKKENSFTQENIKFLEEFTSKINEPGFAFFYRNADKINEVMKDEDYSQSMVHSILYKEFVVPEFHTKKLLGNGPDWKKMYTIIAKKYGRYYAGRVTTGARVNWAVKKKNWQEYVKYLIIYTEEYGPKSDNGGQFEALRFNNAAWDVFENTNDTAELHIALKWSLRAITINPEPDWMDTYANILYKLGKTDLSIKWETTLAKAYGNYQDFISTLAKMKAGEPTWKAYK